MSEYTPDTLRRIARDVLNWRLVRINRGWLDEHARKLYDLVAAWEDDIAQREAQDKMMTSQDELNHNLVARIDVLEKTIELAMAVSNERGREAIKRGERIEELERDLRWVMDFAKGQEPWDDDEKVARFNQIEAALEEAQHE